MLLELLTASLMKQSVLDQAEHPQIAPAVELRPGVTFTKYKCVAAEAVNDLSVFGGDNVRIAIATAGQYAVVGRVRHCAAL